MRDARRREAGDGEPRVERRRGVRESEGEVRRRREEEMAERGGAREHREAVGGELEGGASWSLQRKERNGGREGGRREGGDAPQNQIGRAHV